MSSILITSGDSFTMNDGNINWPNLLSSHYDIGLKNVAMGSQGNRLISNKLIYAVNKELKVRRKEEIIVGVMWGDLTRIDYYRENSDQLENIDGWVENPTSVVEEEGYKNWIIGNAHWKTPQIRLWYDNFANSIGQAHETIKEILFIQWYLERNNIKYFMSTIYDLFNSINNKTYHPELSYLYDMIDFSKFLPVIGFKNWVEENYPILGFNEFNKRGNKPFHPNIFGIEKFVNEVIIPYIDENKLII